MYFMRSVLIASLHQQAKAQYQLSDELLGIPKQAFHNPMTLIPRNLVNQWSSRLAGETRDYDIMVQLAEKADLEQFAYVTPWLLSGVDLAQTIRKINIGLSNFDNAALFYPKFSGRIVRWEYHCSDTPCLHDSVRTAAGMVKFLRLFLGSDYAPMRIKLVGQGKNTNLYTEFFGCDIDWNSSCTQVWFDVNSLNVERQSNLLSKKRHLAMTFSDLDQLLNMPVPNDEIKGIYEAIAFSRFYGMPTLESTSAILDLSVPQLKRRFNKHSINFTQATGYVLCNLAAQLLAKGSSIQQVSIELGYSSIDGFSRMFKRYRGITPNEYIKNRLI